jgi:hypothetical protein
MLAFQPVTLKLQLRQLKQLLLKRLRKKRNNLFCLNEKPAHVAGFFLKQS